MQCGGSDKSEAGYRATRQGLATFTFRSLERSVGKESVLPESRE